MRIIIRVISSGLRSVYRQYRRPLTDHTPHYEAIEVYCQTTGGDNGVIQGREWRKAMETRW